MDQRLRSQTLDLARKTLQVQQENRRRRQRIATSVEGSEEGHPASRARTLDQVASYTAKSSRSGSSSLSSQNKEQFLHLKWSHIKRKVVHRASEASRRSRRESVASSFNLSNSKEDRKSPGGRRSTVRDGVAASQQMNLMPSSLDGLPSGVKNSVNLRNANVNIKKAFRNTQ